MFHPVRARQGMVASVDALATRVGVDILRQGGNAVDAAVAVGYALAVTHPQAGNIGGGGFMLPKRHLSKGEYDYDLFAASTEYVPDHQRS